MSRNLRASPDPETMLKSLESRACLSNSFNFTLPILRLKVRIQRGCLNRVRVPSGMTLTSFQMLMTMTSIRSKTSNLVALRTSKLCRSTIHRGHSKSLRVVRKGHSGCRSQGPPQLMLNHTSRKSRSSSTSRQKMTFRNPSKSPSNKREDTSTQSIQRRRAASAGSTLEEVCSQMSQTQPPSSSRTVSLTS